MTSKTIPGASADMLKIETMLGELTVGQTLPYATASAAIGRDIQKARHLADRARKRLLDRDHKVYACVANEGFQRLGDVEIVEAGKLTARHVLRQAKKGCAVLVSVADFDAMEPVHKQRHNSTLALLGSIVVLGGKRTMKKIDGMVGASRLTMQQVKAIGETLTGSK